MCKSAAELDYRNAVLMWAEYFENNYLFFSTMLASKGAPYYRSRFLDLIITELRNEVNVTEGKNYGLSEDVIFQFLGSAVVGLVEWWFISGMPFSPQVLAEQLGTLLERNL